jgi:hypothetical protein
MLRRSVLARYGGPYHQSVYTPKASHYLAVHDAAKNVLPTVKIEANITTRRDFQSHMQILVDDSFDHDRMVPFVTAMQESLDSAVVEPRTDDFGVTIRFFDDVIMSVMFGRPNVTVNDVLACNDERLRKLLRASLGCDENMYKRSLPAVVVEAELHCVRNQQRRLGEDFGDTIPRLYWLVVCDMLHTKFREQMPGRLANEAVAGLPARSGAIPNPILPEEDIEQLPSVRELRAWGQGAIGRFADQSVYSREVNIIGKGVCPTQDEYEALLIERGLVPPPLPPRKGFLARLFGKSTDAEEKEGDAEKEAAFANFDPKNVVIPKDAIISPARQVVDPRAPGGVRTAGDVSTLWLTMGMKR